MEQQSLIPLLSSKKNGLFEGKTCYILGHNRKKGCRGVEVSRGPYFYKARGRERGRWSMPNAHEDDFLGKNSPTDTSNHRDFLYDVRVQ